MIIGPDSIVIIRTLMKIEQVHGASISQQKELVEIVKRVKTL